MRKRKQDMHPDHANNSNFTKIQQKERMFDERVIKGIFKT